jgi:predicted Fe-Mo cluster-binding NifX family protein
MRIAIPVAAGKLAAHFGHCEQFALIDVDEEKKKVLSQEMIGAPPHQPGMLPGWLAKKGADTIIAGGMGVRAQQLFAMQNIRVVIGAMTETPETVAKAFLEGTLETGPNICDH